ncbi:hypothetical protein RA263_28155, partial [Pseudomonas syringae pv. tagetis]|uniref:hypothetical protein n=1 Tax=Pseudomonas syringae group genomosp. 7 TaxID=251699 RepID=UPI00376FC41C
AIGLSWPHELLWIDAIGIFVGAVDMREVCKAEVERCITDWANIALVQCGIALRKCLRPEQAYGCRAFP